MDETPPATSTRTCTATRTNGEPCRAYALRGATVCMKHGGQLPTVRDKAIRNVETAKAVETMRNLRGTPAPVDNPLEALSQHAAHVVEWCDYLRLRITHLTQLHTDTVMGQQVKADIALYERALKLSTEVLSNLVKMGIDERLARVTEMQGARMVLALERAFDRVGQPFTPGMRRALAAELREVS